MNRDLIARDNRNLPGNIVLMTIKFSGFTSFGSWLRGNRVLALKIDPSK